MARRSREGSVGGHTTTALRFFSLTEKRTPACLLESRINCRVLHFEYVVGIVFRYRMTTERYGSRRFGRFQAVSRFEPLVKSCVRQTAATNTRVRSTWRLSSISDIKLEHGGRQEKETTNKGREGTNAARHTSAAAAVVPDWHAYELGAQLRAAKKTMIGAIAQQQDTRDRHIHIERLTLTRLSKPASLSVSSTSSCNKLARRTRSSAFSRYAPPATTHGRTCNTQRLHTRRCSPNGRFSVGAGR